MSETGKSLPPDLDRHLSRVADSLGDLRVTVRMVITDAMAVTYHTGRRPSGDVDAIFSHRVALPGHLSTFFMGGSDTAPGIAASLNAGVNDALGTFPPGWEDRAGIVSRKRSLEIRVMDPVDLAVSKIGRFRERDRQDIEALAGACLLAPSDVAARLEEALEMYHGDIAFIRDNASEALEMTRKSVDDCAP